MFVSDLVLIGVTDMTTTMGVRSSAQTLLYSNLSGSIPLVASSLKDQNCFTSIYFLYFKSMNFTETSNRNETGNQIIPDISTNIYTIFLNF